MLTKPSLLKKIALLLTTSVLITCTNPVAPNFDFIEDLIYIEGFIGTEEGSSYVKVSKSDVALYYRNVFVSGASIFFVNSDTNERVELFEDDAHYLPAYNFKGNFGERWSLEVNLPNGNQYLSEIETINSTVPIKELSFKYDKKLEFVDDYDKFLPGHEVSVTFDDPENEANYYFWRSKTYAKKNICRICHDGKFRDNDCTKEPSTPYQYYYFTYRCESDCWQIDYNNKIFIFSDEFSNGATTSSLPVANILLKSKSNILVKIEQFSLTKSTYEYYKTIKDLIENNGGLNAPLPAALIGNMYNPQNSNEYVLGRFTATSASTKSIFIDRTQVEEFPIEKPIRSSQEPPPDNVVEAPCEENRYSTLIQPEGWID